MLESGLKDRITSHGHAYNTQRWSFIVLGFAAGGLGFVISWLDLGFPARKFGV